jgi:MoxR-like ATPase
MLHTRDVLLYGVKHEHIQAPLGRNYVIPEDIRALAPDVLRHRLVLTFEAEAEDLDSDALITRILDAVEVP